ncbi:hypothetical protein Tco_1482470 [Tanacetum coccineum]
MTLAKQTKENSVLLMKIDNLENAFADEVKRVTHLEKIISQKTKDFDVVKLELSNKKLNLKRILENLKIQKLTQLDNLKGKSVETKFDKPSILGKPPADKLLIKSQISKSWFAPKVVVQQDLSKPVTAQYLPKNEKDQLLKRIAYLESKLASQDLLNTSSTEISVVKQKYDELLTKSLLTRSQFEGQLKEKTKVISDLKVKEGKDIDTMIEMDKQIKFLNEILYKRNQSIQTIHMLAPKCATYNGRSTFANPKYLKMAQSDKPRLYEIPYDTSDPANRFCPNGEETVTLEKESRSKLDKDTVKPYNYTYQNSLYETFKPPSKAYLDQLERAKEVRKTMWRKTTSNAKAVFELNVEKTVQLILSLLTLDSQSTYGQSRSCCAPFLNDKMMSVHISSGLVLHQMTSDHNRSELGIQDHSNEPSSSKLVPKVVPLAVKEQLHHRQDHKVVRLGINPMIQPEPEDLPKDNPKLEIAVLRVILFSIHNDEWKSFQCHHQTALRSNVDCNISDLEKKSGEKKNIFESKTCVFQIKIAELEKTLAKQTKENFDLLIKIDNLENAFADEVKRATIGKLTIFDKENYDFGSKVTHLEKIISQKTKDFDDVKLELSNKTAKFEAYFEKLENTKVVLERQLARKVDDSKAEKDQFW